VFVVLWLYLVARPSKAEPSLDSFLLISSHCNRCTAALCMRAYRKLFGLRENDFSLVQVQR
jgi:hypothetical protein